MDFPRILLVVLIVLGFFYDGQFEYSNLEFSQLRNQLEDKTREMSCSSSRVLMYSDST